MVRQNLTAAAMAAHAADLAVAFNVRLITSPLLRPEEAFAEVKRRAVFATTIVDETTYAVVLHEIGHLAAPTGSLVSKGARGSMNLQRVEEDAAWAWARHYALDWTPAMEAVATWAEGTYQAPAPEPAKPIPATPSIDWSKWK